MWWESFVDCLYTESVVQRNLVMENQTEEKEYQHFCFLPWNTPKLDIPPSKFRCPPFTNACSLGEGRVSTSQESLPLPFWLVFSEHNGTESSFKNEMNVLVLQDWVSQERSNRGDFKKTEHLSSRNITNNAAYKIKREDSKFLSK